MIVEPKREILLVPLLRAGIKRAWIARDHFIRLGIVPLAVLLLIAVPEQNAMKSVSASLNASAATEADAGAVLDGLFLALLKGAALAVFALNWVRQLTLGPAAVPGLGLALSARHVRFLIVMLMITIGVLLPTVLVAAITLMSMPNPSAGVFAVFVIGMLLWITLIARLSPSWIGMAIDARMPLSIAWTRTAGQGFKLLVALLAVEVVVMIAQEFLSEILAMTGLMAVAPYSFLLVALAMGLAGIAVQISILVTAFPHFLRETV